MEKKRINLKLKTKWKQCNLLIENENNKKKKLVYINVHSLYVRFIILYVNMRKSKLSISVNQSFQLVI